MGHFPSAIQITSTTLFLQVVFKGFVKKRAALSPRKLVPGLIEQETFVSLFLDLRGLGAWELQKLRNCDGERRKQAEKDTEITSKEDAIHLDTGTCR